MSWENRPLRRIIHNLTSANPAQPQPQPKQSRISEMREAKKQEWQRRAIDPKLISMALDLADQRARGTAAIVPSEFSEAREAVFLQQYEQALDVAERWIESVS